MFEDGLEMNGKFYVFDSRPSGHLGQEGWGDDWSATMGLKNGETVTISPQPIFWIKDKQGGMKAVPWSEVEVNADATVSFIVAT